MPVSRRSDNGNVPDGLQPYVHHGMDLTIQNKHGIGDCPFCTKEGKFSVDCDTGLWRCWACGGGTDKGGGNALIFLRLLHQRAVQTTDKPFLQEVAEDRRLCSSETVKAWGVCRSPIASHSWLIPGYGPDGDMDQLYRRARIQNSKDEWVWCLQPTPGVWPVGKAHALHMARENYDPQRSAIVVCEGPWDGMALWEVLGDEMGNVNVIAVPGCNVWRDRKSVV